MASNRFGMVGAAALAIGMAIGAPMQGQNASKTPNPPPKAAAEKRNPVEEPIDLDAPVFVVNGEEWIVGRADEFTENTKEGVRRLTGKVRIKRPNGYLNADNVTMNYDPNSTDKAVEKTVSEGNVNIKEDDLITQSDRAEFTEGNDVITLIGSVVVISGEERMECEWFRYDRRTGERQGKGGVKFLVKYKQSEEEPAASETNGNTDAPKPDAEPTKSE